MDSEHRPSIWFSIGLASLTLAVGPFVLGFLTLITWGLILVPVVVLFWFGPLALLHWVLWGWGFSQEVPEGAQGAEGRGVGASVNRPTALGRVLWFTGGLIVFLGIVLFYLSLCAGSTEPRFLRVESRPDGTLWIRDVTLEK